MEHRASDDALLLAFVEGRDAACPVCGYNLRGLKRPACPECAAELRLAVSSPRLAMGSWLLAVIAAALGLGFDGVVTILISGGLALFPPRVPAQKNEALSMLATFVVLALASAAALVWSVRSRRRWTRWALPRQRAAGLAVFVTVGLVHAAVGLLIARRM